MGQDELELYKILGKMLREIRNSKGYSLEEVSDKLGITKKTLSRYETGEHRVKLSTIESLCSIYNVDYGNLVHEAKAKFKGTHESENSYYIDDDVRELAQFLHDSPEYKVLFDASRRVKKEDIDFVKRMIDKFGDDN